MPPRRNAVCFTGDEEVFRNLRASYLDGAHAAAPVSEQHFDDTTEAHTPETLRRRGSRHSFRRNAIAPTPAAGVLESDEAVAAVTASANTSLLAARAAVAAASVMEEDFAENPECFYRSGSRFSFRRPGVCWTFDQAVELERRVSNDLSTGGSARSTGSDITDTLDH